MHLPTFWGVLRRTHVGEEEAGRLAAHLDRTFFALRYMRNEKGRPWHVREYQQDSLESNAPRKVHCDGRDVGKTSEIEIIAAWASVMRPRSQMLIATQTENHLFPLMHRLVRRFETTAGLAANLAEIKRTPSWYLRFKNGFQLWGRISGPRGVNFQGMHVDWQIVDEAQEMTDTAWGELFQALNSDGMRWVYGVPNGLRNMFYRMTQMPDVELHRWPSHLNPGFGRAKDVELIHLYGGTDSPGYIHRVLGEHGAPAHGVFHLDDYLACVDETLEFHDIELGEDDSFEAPAVEGGEYYLGCDLGYARDPSEFVVYQSVPPHLINVLRIHLGGVNYARQQEIIEELDGAYAFRSIGIDCGNSGRAVIHNLKILGTAWCDKIRAFEFGGMTDLGEQPDKTRLRRRTKEFMTELLDRHMAERSIVFPRLPDRETQYASHTYSVGASDRIVYEKGNDHIIDADRCAVLAHYLDTEDTGYSASAGVVLEGF